MKKDILTLAASFKESFLTHHKIFATAESCTGGLAAASITEIAGSSQWFDRGFVTYTNEAKAELLGIDPLVIEKYGAVSLEVARQMALGALEHSRADIAVGITGIAGPGGGSEQKPVGTVCIGFAVKNKGAVAKIHHFLGNREEVRLQSVQEALKGMLLLAESKTLDCYR